jgi:hypothetical protein
MIIDDIMQRITLYNSEKKKFEVVAKMNPPARGTEMFHLSKNKLLVYDRTNYKANKNLLYVKSYDWKTRYYDFGHSSVFINSNDPLLEDKIQYTSPALSICVVNENKIVAAPKFYDGELTLYTNENGEWKSKRFSGFKPKYPSFEKMNNDHFKKADFKNEMHIGAGTNSSYNYAYIQHSKSSYIFTYKNKYILHFFSVCKHPKNVVGYLDVFDMEGRYLGNTITNNDSKDSMINKYRAINILWKDKDENFYISENVDNSLVIKKVKIDITF